MEIVPRGTAIAERTIVLIAITPPLTAQIAMLNPTFKLTATVPALITALRTCGHSQTAPHATAQTAEDIQ
jgi:hypothetical protein